MLNRKKLRIMKIEGKTRKSIEVDNFFEKKIK